MAEIARSTNPCASAPKPGDMSRFSVSAFMRKPDERRTQAFVDQEFHSRPTASNAIASDAFGCRNCHPVFVRGRPRRG
jgi:hypothetical protein